MNANSTPRAGRDLVVTATLARLLERLERSAQPVDPVQYRSVALHLMHEFEDVPPEELRSVLDAFPAASELYENLHYQHAGLCRSGLDGAMSAELQARQAIERVRASAAAPNTSRKGTDVQH
ncbi:MAG: hypothetical protein QM586_05890 [Xenophilus sp.]